MEAGRVERMTRFKTGQRALASASSSTKRAAKACARKRVLNVAVLFVDIQGCTRLCEDLRPSAMARIIERYFSRFLQLVENHNGYVAEVHGDGLLALFEGPSLRQDAARAFSVASAISHATRALNVARGRRHDPIIVNMGINAGPALVGAMRLRGGSGEQAFCSTSGPVINIAARLCALATGGKILLTRDVARMLNGAHAVRRLGPRSLKNVGAPVDVFESDAVRQ